MQKLKNTKLKLKQKTYYIGNNKRIKIQCSMYEGKNFIRNMHMTLKEGEYYMGGTRK